MQSIDAGDHTIFIGRVVQAAAPVASGEAPVASDEGPAAGPLIWYLGGYERMSGERGE